MFGISVKDEWIALLDEKIKINITARDFNMAAW